MALAPEPDPVESATRVDAAMIEILPHALGLLEASAAGYDSRDLLLASTLGTSSSI